jgi:GNAT superfamily N-acetyltransferase
MTDAAGDVATVTLGGRSTRVKLVRLWEVDAPAFRERVADVFQSVWPDRRGEEGAIRRGAHTPERKPTPLVLVPADESEGETPEVLGYTIVYPSSAVRRPPGENRKSEECANCTLNSVLVPAALRGRGVGAALVKLAARCATRELGFECVTAWCQPRLVPFYEACGFAYEPPRRAARAGTRKDALWAKLLNRGDDGDGDCDGDGDTSSGDDELDECVRMFVPDPRGSAHRHDDTSTR